MNCHFFPPYTVQLATMIQEKKKEIFGELITNYSVENLDDHQPGHAVRSSPARAVDCSTILAKNDRTTTTT